MGLGAGDDVFDVGLGRAVEPGSCVRAVDDAAHARDDARLDGLRIGVVVGFVRGTAMLRRRLQALARSRSQPLPPLSPWVRGVRVATVASVAVD